MVSETLCHLTQTRHDCPSQNAKDLSQLRPSGQSTHGDANPFAQAPRFFEIFKVKQFRPYHEDLVCAAVIATELMRHVPVARWLFPILARPLLKSIPQGAATQASDALCLPSSEARHAC
jgi:hypothetical protein